MAMTEYHSNGLCPKSAAVHVTEISDESVNPTPVSNRGYVDLGDDYLTEQRLREITRSDDLTTVFTLDLQVDADRMSVGDFWSYLPNLKQLRLSNSSIHTIRDLGTSLNNVEVVWMPRCHLISLDGLSIFTKLVELYVAFNGISDLSPCAMLHNIEVMDLEGNLIEEKSNLSHLRLCRNLTTLTLEGNPLVTKCGGKIRYRKVVRKTLPQITTLDDICIQKNPSSNLGEYDITKFDSEWSYINTLLKEVGLLSVSKKGIRSADKSQDPLGSEETIEAGRSTLGLRPTSALKQRYHENTLGCRGSISSQTTTHMSRSSSVVMDAEVFSDEEGRVSELTTGGIICGGISSALRNRRSTPSKAKRHLYCGENNLMKMKTDNLNLNDTANKSSIQKADNITTDAECDLILKEESLLREECDNVLKELADWRKMYSQSQVFKSCKRIKKTSKITNSDSESDTILQLGNSNHTKNYEINEKLKCYEDIRVINPDIKSASYLKSKSDEKQDKCTKKSTKVTEKTNNSTGESHVKIRQANNYSDSVDDRSIGSASTSNTLKYSSISRISRTTTKLTKACSAVISSSSNCSSRKQTTDHSASGIECIFDEEMMVNKESGTQDSQYSEYSLQKSQQQKQLFRTKIIKSSDVNLNNKTNRNESGNKLVMKLSKSSTSAIQALPSKPLVKRED
ncbi:unnamed protein product [Heterobilharzia americana]|nr:unnamed protein product [Heterobilharzia americana]